MWDRFCLFSLRWVLDPNFRVLGDGLQVSGDVHCLSYHPQVTVYFLIADKHLEVWTLLGLCIALQKIAQCQVRLQINNLITSIVSKGKIHLIFMTFWTYTLRKEKLFRNLKAIVISCISSNIYLAFSTTMITLLLFVLPIRPMFPTELKLEHFLLSHLL